MSSSAQWKVSNSFLSTLFVSLMFLLILELLQNPYLFFCRNNSAKKKVETMNDVRGLSVGESGMHENFKSAGGSQASTSMCHLAG